MKRRHSKEAKSGAAGVAYVETCVSAAGLIWREISGVDIGIDGEIEIPDHSYAGWTFVQIKTRGAAFLSTRTGKLSFRCDPNHDAYWMAQPLPVVLCLVERRRNTFVGHTAYWINYKAIPFEAKELPTRSGRTGIARIAFSKLSESSGSQPVLITKRPAKSAAKLERWLKNVVKSPREVLETYFLDHLLEGGQYALALERLSSIVPMSLGVEIELLRVKTYRRAGLFDQINNIAHIILGQDIGPREQRLLSYEFGYAFLVLAMEESISKMRPSSNSAWGRSFQYFQRSFADFGDDLASLTERLIGLSGLVSAKAMGMAMSKAEGPDEGEVRELETALSEWVSKEHIDRRENARRVLNARLALARFHLSRRQPGAAEIQFELLERDVAISHYNSPRLIAHYLVLKAWAKDLRDESVQAETYLQASILAGRPLADDPELRSICEFVRSLISRRAQ